MELTTILEVALIICCLGLTSCAYGIIKALNDCKQEIKIIDAIYEFSMSNNISIEKTIDMYNSMKNLKWYDWGNENIVPRETYDKIKPYIKG